MILISPVTDRRLDPPQNVAWSRHPPDINLGLVSGQMDIPSQIPLQLTAQYNVVLNIRYLQIPSIAFSLFFLSSNLCRYNNDDLKMFLVTFPFTMVERYNNIYSIDILLTKIYNTEIRNK